MGVNDNRILTSEMDCLKLLLNDGYCKIYTNEYTAKM